MLLLLLLLLLLWPQRLGGVAGQRQPARDGGGWEGGSGIPPAAAVEVNLLDKLVSYSQEFGNFSLGYDEANCSILDIGQYATLSIPSAEAFGENFVDELSLLLMLRYSLKEDTSLLTIIGLHNNILFQIRISPYALVFVASRRRHYEFPVSSLADGNWHRVAFGISTERLVLYVDCQLVESVGWSSHFGMEVTTEGLVIFGGLIEPFEIPFEGSLRQLTLWMGDARAAREHCQAYYSSCGRTLVKKTHRSPSHAWELFPQAWTQVELGEGLETKV